MVIDITVLTKLKGHRVRLNVNNEEYEGIVVNVTPATLCITLGKVRCLSDEIYYHVLYFYTYEIESCTPLDALENIKKDPSKSNNLVEEDGPRLVKLRPLPFQEKGKARVNICNDNLLIGGLEDKKEGEYLLDEISDKSDDTDEEAATSENFKYTFPSTNIILDKIDDEFHLAISNIMKELIIGISLEGINMGRNGKICWLLVGTDSHVYLFDIYTLGKFAFDNGLKDVIQNPSILKVLHDCREPSDALFHLYEVRLVNIFDTQSSDALVHYKQYNKMPRVVHNLSSCLSHYLKLNIKIPDFSRKQEQLGDDLSVWTHRPLPKKLVKLAAKRVKFLKELRFAIFQRYIADLNHGAEIYLAILRDSSEQELEFSRCTLHTLPAAFQKIQLKHKKYSQGHQFFEPSFTDDSLNKLKVADGHDPFAAATRSFWFQKNKDQKKESVADRSVNHISQNHGEYRQGDHNRVPNGRYDTSNELSKPCATLSYSSLIPDDDNSSKRCGKNNPSEDWKEPESQFHYNSPKYENLSQTRSFPKRRLDWPKMVSQNTNGTTTPNIPMIPAGMVPLSAQYPKKK